MEVRKAIQFMTIDIYLTEAEQISFLTSLGYEVKKTIVPMGYPCYHNDMEHADVEVWAVYKAGHPFAKPGGYNFRKDEWLERVVKKELHVKLKKLLLA